MTWEAMAAEAGALVRQAKAEGRRLYPQQQLRLTDAKGRTYYPSWLEAVDGNEETLDTVLDLFDRPDAARPTTERIRRIYRLYKQHMRDVSDFGGPYECETCGEKFTPPQNYVTAVYCSNACRQKAYRARRKLEAAP